MILNPILAQANNGGSAAGGFLVGTGLIFLLVGLLYIAIWIYALVNAATSTSLNSTEKLVWVLLIFFVPFVGTLLYFLIGRKA